MFMDMSSEMVHSLLPVFLVGTLGASMATVGVIEGVAEATGQISKVFSGWLSDRLGHRKWLAVTGYGLSALTKPAFALAASPAAVLGARFADRIGKGVRGAPRDALVADVTAPEVRGAAFGLRQALDTIGAFVGPLAAMGLMLALGGDIRAVFGWAVVPGMLAVLLLAMGVREPPVPEGGRKVAPLIRLSELGGLGAGFWVVAAVGVAFTLARFSEAFLLLRAAGLGLPGALVPLVMVLMNIVYAAVAAPAGRLSDHIDRRLLLAAGLGVLLLADAALGLGRSLAPIFGGVALWGVHLGLTQGVLAAMVADTAPPQLRGTAFGAFNLTSGLAALAGGVLAGWLWSAHGPSATFAAGAGFTIIAGLGLMATLKRQA